MYAVLNLKLNSLLPLFHGMFRISELIVNKGDNNHTVMINDIQITDIGLEINLKSSKIDQFGKGTVVQISRG